MAESILYNANIITLDADLPKAKLIVIQDGIIKAVSNEDRINEYKSKNTVFIDCGGKTLLPGFIDTHLHFHAYAESFQSLNLSPRNHVRSIGDIQSKIRKQISTLGPGFWIRARGYNEFYPLPLIH